MSLTSVIVIPARLASTRLPAKPLVEIFGKSVLQRTYEQCIKAVDREKVFVATDHESIQAHCHHHGIPVVMTSPDCLTGTDRVAEFATYIEADYYINVQGDEPLINPQDIVDVDKATQQYGGEVINGYAPITDAEQYTSLTIPKVVVRPDGRLLYMSRSAIPGNKQSAFKTAWRQICVYGFPREALFKFTSQGSKTALEALEDIEILRFLELGYEVRMIPLSADSIAVDTPEDVEKVKSFLRASISGS
jgi:3-deoxy-manno-octulosonate cytidylyltransferase (CMP-KDO synthetase)